MNSADRTLLEREGDELVVATSRVVPSRARERFRMAYSKQFNQVRKAPTGFNGMHRRRRKKVW